MIANLRILTIILPKIISYELSQHLLGGTNEGSGICRSFFSLLIHNTEFLENLIKNDCIRNCIVPLGLNELMICMSCSFPLLLLSFIFNIV